MPHDLDLLNRTKLGYMSSGELSENLSAIVDYFNKQEPTTTEARQIKSEFDSWYAGLSWWDKSDVNAEDTFTKARNFRDRFNLANKYLSSDELKERQRTGVTYEKAAGLPERARTDSGLIAEAPKPAIPTEYKVAAVAAAVLGVVLFLLKRIP